MENLRGPPYTPQTWKSMDIYGITRESMDSQRKHRIIRELDTVFYIFLGKKLTALRLK